MGVLPHSPVPDGPERRFHICETAENRRVNDEIFELSLSWPGPAPRAGQFFMLKPVISGVFLPRPISVFSWEAESRRVHFLIARRGRGSAELEALKKGDRAELSGPLGNSWEEQRAGLHREGPLALIGGGIGIAPLSAFSAELTKWDYDFYAGFRSSPYGLDHVQPKSLYIATEDGCEGCKGRIPDLLDPGKYAGVFACGPEAMLRSVVRACKKTDTPCFISMERHMACGAGACLGCTVKTSTGNRRCCTEGPIFRAEEVLF